MKNIWRSITAPPYRNLPWLVFFYIIACALIVPDGGVFTGHLFGFDDHVHMVQVLNWINGAGWYDRTITRVNAPEGFTSIWPRIVDIPIAAIVLAVQQFTAQKTAALIASAVITVSYSALLLVFAGPYFARPLVGKNKARLISLFLLFTSLFIYKGFSPSGFFIGQVSHHPWYVILDLLMFGAVARIVMGSACKAPVLMLALSVTLSSAVGIESYPVIAGSIGILALAAWGFNRPNIAARGGNALLISAAGALLLLPMHQPPEHLFLVSFTEPSILGAFLFTVAALFLKIAQEILHRLPARKAPSAFLLCFTAAFLGVGLLWAFPDMRNGAAAGLSPSERAMAFTLHTEAWPIWKNAHGNADLICLIMPLALALGAALSSSACSAKNHGSRRRAVAFAYLGFSAVSIGMSCLFSRYYHHAMTTSCAWLLWAWERIKEHARRKGRSSLYALAIFIVLGPLWTLLIPSAIKNRTLDQVLLFPALPQTLPDLCDSMPVADYINAHYDKNTLLFVPYESSAKFLYQTGLHIDFLALYPSHDKFIDNFKFLYTSKPEQAAEIASRHGIDLVAACAYTPAPPTAGKDRLFVTLLQTGKAPAWLQRVNSDALGNFILYEVDKKALDKSLRSKD